MHACCMMIGARDDDDPRARAAGRAERSPLSGAGRACTPRIVYSERTRSYRSRAAGVLRELLRATAGGTTGSRHG